MNIFYLDHNPIKAAQYLCDKHMKMILETAQILSTISIRYNIEAPYRATHKNHPAVRWAGDTIGNWLWTVQHGLAISEEYHKRYGKIHKSSEIIKWCQEYGGRPSEGELKQPRQCMPEEYKGTDAVVAYRRYYINDKARFATWREPSLPPTWFTDIYKIKSWRLVDDKGNEYGPIIRGIKL